MCSREMDASIKTVMFMTLDIKKMTRLRCHFSIAMIMIFKVREECLKIDNDDEKTRKRQREKMPA